MQRRTFLKYLSAAPLVAYLPNTLADAFSSREQKTLVLIQLDGGNDSLNTFVPLTDPAYYSARSSLAISADSAIPLTNALGLNPVMAPLMESWNGGDMAVVQGLGYAQPNRSHFRSLAIWQTASDAEQVLSAGWVAPLSMEEKSLTAVVLAGDSGILAGQADFFVCGEGKIAKQMPVIAPSTTSDMDTLNYVVQQRTQYNRSLSLVQQALSSPLASAEDFLTDDFGQQCQAVAKLLLSSSRPAVIHLKLGGFDTHRQQRQQHDKLLAQLAHGLAALRQTLMAASVWQQVTLATYAEFGRRVAENASAGTDHGTAASHLVMGGQVNGGIWGQMPSLTRLDAGDMLYTQEFRGYYKTLADWMAWPSSAQLQGFANLGFV